MSLIERCFQEERDGKFPDRINNNNNNKQQQQ